MDQTEVGIEMGNTTPEKFAACVKERMKLGMTQGEAESYCLAYTTTQDWPSPVNQPTKTEDVGATGKPANATIPAKATQIKQDVPSDGSEGAPSGGEKTPLEKCIQNQVDGGKSPDEAEAWCKADLAGEHESIDSLVTRTKENLEMKRQFDIERKRQQRQHPL